MSIVIALTIVGVLFFPEFVGRAAGRIYRGFDKGRW